MTKIPPFAANLFGEPIAEKKAKQQKNTVKAAKIAERQAAAPAAAVSVAVPVPQAALYSYAAPRPLPEGAAVQAPLGGRSVAGLVFADKTVLDSGRKLKSVDKIFDCPVLPAELMRFLRFFAAYTMTPLGMAARLALAVPAALEPLPGQPALRWTGQMPQKPSKARARVLGLLRRQNLWSRSGLAHAAGVSAGVLDGLKAQGVLAPAFLPAALAAPEPQADYAPPKLTAAQSEAAAALVDLARQKQFGAALLEGVTGSGKTEVYFEAIAEILRQGRQALLLLPEIALTQQVLARFERRFGAKPAAWHSGLSPKQREKIWRQVLEGQVRIVAGARSALFLPFADLGLIIVDEEHDAAFKQEERIFYHGRDMAVARGKCAGIPVILSSATPSVESCVNALQGRYRHLILPARFGGGVLPQIGIVDMRQNPPPKGRFLSAPLVAAIEQTLQKGEQSLLFLNRRGYAPLTLCRACGHRFSCADCSAWLVEHRRRGLLLCHHCGFQRPLPEACPECGALDHLAPVGPGVERIAEEVRALWPQARHLVLSADSGESIARIRAELEAVRRGEIDILIGTQLVAKGHHFPKLTFVGAVDADIGMSNGDLRAAERSFQLLSQVTGRAGRCIAESRGLIQTYQPEHKVIKALARGESAAFIRREIEERAAYHLPPFGRLAAIIISAKDRKAAASHARALRRFAPEADFISVLGPAEAPLARLRGRWRFRLLAQAAGRAVHLQDFLRAWASAAPKPPAAVRVQIDIDPQSFL